MDDLVDDDCMAALFVKALARAGVDRMAARAADMIGALSPVPSEPQRAR